MQYIVYGNNTTLTWTCSGISFYITGKEALSSCELSPREMSKFASFFRNIRALDEKGIKYFLEYTDTLFNNNLLLEAISEIHTTHPSLVISGSIPFEYKISTTFPCMFDRLEPEITHKIRQSACLRELKQSPAYIKKCKHAFITEFHSKYSTDCLIDSLFRLYSIKKMETDNPDLVFEYMLRNLVVDGYAPGYTYYNLVCALEDGRMNDLYREYGDDISGIENALFCLESVHAGSFVPIYSDYFLDLQPGETRKEAKRRFYHNTSDGIGRMWLKRSYDNCIAQRIIPRDTLFEDFIDTFRDY